MRSVVELRRALHRIPELDFDLPKTLAFIRAELEKLPCTIFEPAKSSICAFFDAGRADTIAFRSDMDALPITEHSEKDYCSAHPGMMHACGHDGHMAMLLAFAQKLADEPALLEKHNALLIFQPAEETTGGAKGICDSGIFEKTNTVAIFGVHLQPHLEAGRIATRPGPIMAACMETDVTFIGKSAHISKAHEGLDAIEAVCRYLPAAYDMVENELPADEVRVLKYGLLAGGTVRNALAAEAKVSGTMRYMRNETGAFLEKRVRQLGEEAANRTGCRVRFRFGDAYPPVVNDAALYEKVMAHCGKELGIAEAEAEMTSEDFSFYGQVAPAVFFRLGTGDTPGLHAVDFDFDDSLLEAGPRLYAALMSL